MCGMLRLAGLLVLLTGTAACSHLNAILGVNWSNYASRGTYQDYYLTTDFLDHVIKPLYNRLATELEKQETVETLQTIGLLCCAIFIVTLIIGALVWWIAGLAFGKRLINVLKLMRKLDQRDNMEVAAAIV